MSKVRALLGRYGGSPWPDARTPAYHPPELTVAARRLAESALEQLGKLGVTVKLDGGGRARFRAAGTPSRDAKLMLEKHGDLIESYLRERAEQESGG